MHKRILFMEQKRTLWIVAAAGIFLLVVVGAALILYSPSLHQSSGLQAGFDPASGWISSTKTSATPVPESALTFNNETPVRTESEFAPSPFTSLENNVPDNTVRADKVTVISDNATVYSNETTTIDLNSLKASSGTSSVAKNDFTEKQMQRPASQPQAFQEPKNEIADNYYAPAPVAKSAPVKEAAAKPVAKVTPAPKSTAQKSVSVAKTPSKAESAKKVAASAKKAPDSFWVQAAAYTSKRNADEARSTLESNKIPSEVFTFTDSNGKTFYRVRVGPYVTKSEAEYWQTRIGMIDKFASAKSVIVNTAIN